MMVFLFDEDIFYFLWEIICIRIIKVGFLVKFVEYFVFLIVLLEDFDFGYFIVFLSIYRIFV